MMPKNQYKYYLFVVILALLTLLAAVRCYRARGIQLHIHTSITCSFREFNGHRLFELDSREDESKLNIVVTNVINISYIIVA